MYKKKEAVYQHKTHIAVDLMKRSPCLVFPVDELQVDWGSRAEQAVGFGLDISSERRHTNVEPLNDLPKEQKHRNVNQTVSLIL